MKHDEHPQITHELPEELVGWVQKLHSSPYFKYVQSLLPLVKGRLVVKTEAGTSGFVLHLDDNSWVLAYLEASKFVWQAGEDTLPEDVRALVNSSIFGDASKPLPDNLPYATDTCDFSSEVSKAVGQRIIGLSIRENSFNFCFPEGLALDVVLRQDKIGKLAYRVFWEQW